MERKELDMHILNEKKAYMDGHIILFRVSGKYFALSVWNVLQICTFPQITHIPLPDSNITGICNWNGTIIPVIDMRQFFSQSHYTDILQRGILIFSKKHVMGLQVDEIDEIIEKNTEDMTPVEEPSLSYISQRFMHLKKEFYFLDANKMIDQHFLESEGLMN